MAVYKNYAGMSKLKAEGKMRYTVKASYLLAQNIIAKAIEQAIIDRKQAEKIAQIAINIFSEDYPAVLTDGITGFNADMFKAQLISLITKLDTVNKL